MSIRVAPILGVLLALGLGGSAHAASFTPLYIFPGPPGAGSPSEVSAIGNTLVGVTTFGGSTNTGTLYTLDLTTDVVTIANDFDGSMGVFPGGKLFKLGTTFYGATSGTGVPKRHNAAAGGGTIFRYGGSGGFSVLTTFDGPGPYYPNGDLAYHDGLLYGASGNGPGLHGTLFQVDATTGTETTLYDFPGGAHGDAADGGLLYSNGALYGVDFNSTGGAVFRFDLASAKFRVVHLFTGGTSGGYGPLSGLVDLAGKLYGVTEYGGTAEKGTIFEVDAKTGAETIVHSFAGGSDGSDPFARLIVHDGELYGTTADGGTLGNGTIFEFDPAAGAETILHAFNGTTEGLNPSALTFYKGSFYGVTEGHSRYKRAGTGKVPYGIVFKLTP